MGHEVDKAWGRSWLNLRIIAVYQVSAMNDVCIVQVRGEFVSIAINFDQSMFLKFYLFVAFVSLNNAEQTNNTTELFMKIIWKNTVLKVLLPQTWYMCPTLIFFSWF